MLEFGAPLGWEQKFIDSFSTIGRGWHCLIFTPNKFEKARNIHIVPMTVEEFDNLVEKKLGVHPHNFIKPDGVPDKLISDYYPAFGAIFEDYIKEYDFWGHANWDIVWGKLDHFLPDSFLDEIDIYADEPDTINGVFTIYRNTEKVNNLFKEIPNWQMMFTDHRLFVVDEFPEHMPAAAKRARAEGRIRFVTAEHHSYQPTQDLVYKNGMFVDGKEVLLYHFSRTRPKQWPL